jgi:hypothetical protein
MNKGATALISDSVTTTTGLHEQLRLLIAARRHRVIVAEARLAAATNDFIRARRPPDRARAWQRLLVMREDLESARAAVAAIERPDSWELPPVRRQDG